MNAIKQRRLECGLTQRQLAAAVGGSRSTIQNWERGTYLPSENILPKLSKVLGCRLEDIMPTPARFRRVYTDEQLAIHDANREKAASYTARRQELGLSKRELAEKAGVSLCAVRWIEKGEHYPRWETRQKLRRALRMPEERLYTEEERNEIFFELEKQGVIRMAISKKRQKLRAVHADFDDLYQELVICALRAVDRFQPDGAATLKTFVERNLEFFIERWIAKTCMNGLSGEISYPLPDIQVVSLDALMQAGFEPVG